MFHTNHRPLGPEDRQLISEYLTVLEDYFDNQARALDRFLQAEKERLRLAGQWPPPFPLFPPVESQGQNDQFYQASGARESQTDGKPVPVSVDGQVEAVIRILRSSPTF